VSRLAGAGGLLRGWVSTHIKLRRNGKELRSCETYILFPPVVSPAARVAVGVAKVVVAGVGVRVAIRLAVGVVPFFPLLERVLANIAVVTMMITKPVVAVAAVGTMAIVIFRMVAIAIMAVTIAIVARTVALTSMFAVVPMVFVDVAIVVVLTAGGKVVVMTEVTSLNTPVHVPVVGGLGPGSASDYIDGRVVGVLSGMGLTRWPCVGLLRPLCSLVRSQGRNILVAGLVTTVGVVPTMRVATAAIVVAVFAINIVVIRSAVACVVVSGGIIGCVPGVSGIIRHIQRTGSIVRGIPRVDGIVRSIPRISDVVVILVPTAVFVVQGGIRGGERLPIIIVHFIDADLDAIRAIGEARKTGIDAIADLGTFGHSRNLKKLAGKKPMRWGVRLLSDVTQVLRDELI